MSSSPEEIKKEVKKYLTVFAALLVLTVVTVAISYLHLSVTVAIIVALIVAFTKGSLVACYFMHLISERKVIYLFLTFTAVFFFALLLLPFSEHHSVPEGTSRTETPIIMEKGDHHGA